MGGFENRETYPKLCFIRAFTYFKTQRPTESGSVSSEYLQYFGERYLDPFSFSPGVSFEVFRMLSFSDKKNNKAFSDIYIDVSTSR